MQALAGVLLPSATVFLLLLCNEQGRARTVGEHQATQLLHRHRHLGPRAGA